MGVSVQYSLACPVVYLHCTRESWFSLNLFQNAYSRQSKWKKIIYMYYVILMSATFSRYIFLRFFFNFLKHSTWCVAMLSIIPGWVHSEFVGAQSRCHLKETKSRWIIFLRKDFFWREGDFLATTTTCIIESVSCWYVYEIIRIICIPRVMARAKRDHSYGSVIKRNIYASIRSQL